MSTLRSQVSWLNDSQRSIPTSGLTSTLHRYDNKRLIPDEQNHDALKQFLKYLNDSSGGGVVRVSVV
ncbi:unnamed protein product [Trichobilharzia regenti]|nr:unnamed protein product [Trichobilharzia regenti]